MASNIDWGTNILTGAGTGASAGAQTGTIEGIGIGAVGGTIVGIFKTLADEKKERERKEALEELAAATNTSYNNIQAMFDDFYKNYTPGGTQQDAINAAAKIRNWDSNFEARLKEAGLDDMEAYKFSYDKDVSDFLNPYMGNVIDASNAKIQHSAAGAALGRSTGAAKAISENTAREYNDIYNTALDAYYQDRSQSYDEWQSYINNMQKRLDTMLENDKWGIEQQQALGNQFLDWQAQQVQNNANLQKDRVNAKTQITLAGL